MKKYWLTGLLVIGALGFMIAYQLLPQTIDAQGFLHEPFFLIPLSYLCGLLALITGLITWYRHSRKKS